MTRFPFHAPLLVLTAWLVTACITPLDRLNTDIEAFSQTGDPAQSPSPRTGDRANCEVKSNQNEPCLIENESTDLSDADAGAANTPPVSDPAPLSTWAEEWPEVSDPAPEPTPAYASSADGCANPFGGQAASAGQFICSDQGELLACRCSGPDCSLIPTGSFLCTAPGAVIR